MSGNTTVHECNVDGSGVMNNNNLSHSSCSASVLSSLAAEHKNENSGFETLKEIFPQLPGSQDICNCNCYCQTL